jgi:hypothetical protein
VILIEKKQQNKLIGASHRKIHFVKYSGALHLKKADMFGWLQTFRGAAAGSIKIEK